MKYVLLSNKLLCRNSLEKTILWVKAWTGKHLHGILIIQANSTVVIYKKHMNDTTAETYNVPIVLGFLNFAKNLLDCGVCCWGGTWGWGFILSEISRINEIIKIT